MNKNDFIYFERPCYIVDNLDLIITVNTDATHSDQKASSNIIITVIKIQIKNNNLFLVLLSCIRLLCQHNLDANTHIHTPLCMYMCVENSISIISRYSSNSPFRTQAQQRVQNERKNDVVDSSNEYLARIKRSSASLYDDNVLLGPPSRAEDDGKLLDCVKIFFVSPSTARFLLFVGLVNPKCTVTSPCHMLVKS